MKNTYSVRIAAWLILLAMMLCSLPAVAENVDFSHLNDSEIVTLFEQVTAEIARRGIEKTATLAKGAYIAGEDLPAGKYVYTCLAKGDDWGNLTVYSERGKGKQLLWNVVSAPDAGAEPETVFINLNEGDELKSGVDFSLTISPGVMFR